MTADSISPQRHRAHRGTTQSSFRMRSRSTSSPSAKPQKHSVPDSVCSVPLWFRRVGRGRSLRACREWIFRLARGALAQDDRLPAPLSPFHPFSPASAGDGIRTGRGRGRGRRSFGSLRSLRMKFRLGRQSWPDIFPEILRLAALAQDEIPTGPAKLARRHFTWDPRSSRWFRRRGRRCATFLCAAAP
jgi:hypothetical protein